MDVFIILFLSAVALQWLAYSLRDKEQEQSDEKEPCATCLRWSECNGVDDDCPLRKEVN